MKALVLNALGHGFDFEDVDIAAPIGREVLVNVQASGLCHTDLLFATHDIVPTPAVLGHEVAGIVAAVGPDVAQLRVGDHVVGSLAQLCGACARCLSGRSFQCRHPESTLRRPTDAPRLSRNGTGLFQGFGLGGFAERALIHENQLAVVPKELPFAQAALLGCGVVTGAGSVLNTANVSAGDAVVIFGSGGVGLNAVSGARIAGASRIVVIDIQAKRLDEARRFGATDVIVGNAPAQLAGVAGGLQSTAMQLGGTFGTAVLGAIMSARIDSLLRASWHAAHLPPLTAASYAQVKSAVSVGVAPVPSGTPTPVAGVITQISHATFTAGMHNAACICAAPLRLRVNP